MLYFIYKLERRCVLCLENPKKLGGNLEEPLVPNGLISCSNKSNLHAPKPLWLRSFYNI